jgi:hypothetical protein
MRTVTETLSKNVYTELCCLAFVLAMPLLLNAQGQPGLPVPGNHSAEAGDCPKCNTGEFSTTVEKLVEHGDYVYVVDPPCSSDVSADVTKLGRAAADGALPGLSEAAGPLVDQASANAAKFIGSQARGTIGEILSKYTNPHAQCEVVCAVIPKDASTQAYSLWAGDGDRGASKCEQDANGWIVCPVGFSKWVDPQETKNEKTQLACSTFMNWSHDRARWASMSVYYTMPAGKKPINLR